MFLGVCFLNILNYFSLSLPLFLSLFSAQWGFGEAAWKGRRGLLPGLWSPQSTVKQGEGFLPTQPSVTFYEQQDPRTATAPNLGKGRVCKGNPWSRPLPPLALTLSPFIYWQVNSTVLHS